ncbi:hypothetical protein ACIBG0_16480 [Nocardia sp. NPDC050630]|uniref:DUF7373 family lipoprotein n=1 Tax=Nocardia sp. NPDC050630 TaxID=3364321 RepID=UPI003795C6E5
MRRCDRVRKVRGVLVATVVVLALATGCTVHGQPTPQRPDLGSLDVGGYSLEPPHEPAVDNEKYGRVIESMRLGEVMADPSESDPTLTFPLSGFSAVPLPTPAKAGAYLAAPVRSVLEKQGMLAGFAVGRTDKEVDRTPVVGAARLLTVLVLRFPDPTAAQRAAEDIDSVDASVSPENVSVTIPEYPAAHGHWRPNVPTIAASLAQESFVVTLLGGHTAADLAILTTLVRKAFDAQLPRLRGFAVTPREQLAALPLDRDGMIARMVPKAPGRWPFPAVAFGTEKENAGWDSAPQASGVVYGTHAASLYRGVEKPNPVELMAFSGLEGLMRFPDVAAARKSFAKAQDKADKDGLRSMPGPTGVPDVSCSKESGDLIAQLFIYTCTVLYGRYVAVLFGRTLHDFQQRVAAQYGLLVNSERGI